MPIYEIIKISLISIAVLITSIVWIKMYIDSKRIDKEEREFIKNRKEILKKFEEWYKENKLCIKN